MCSKALLLALALACLGLASARSLKGGRHIEGPVCKWKCDEDFDRERWEDKFDCSSNQFDELNHWAKEKKWIKKGDVCDVPCDAEYKPKKDKKEWHYYGEICQFKADKDYSKGDFCDGFGIEWLVVIALNEDWCEDTKDAVIVFKKGEIIDVPCHYEHKRFGKKWHWKPDHKRKTHGDVCEFKIVKKWHPRRIQRDFDWDWEGCLELNPHLYYRKWCYVEEIIYIPCNRKHKEHGHNWHHNEKKWWCEFDRDDWKPDWDCKDDCPGECRPRKKEYDCDEDRRPRWPETPDWCIPPKPEWGNKDDFCFRPDPVYDFTPDHGWEGEWTKPDYSYGDGNHNDGNKTDSGYGNGSNNGWETNPDKPAATPAPAPQPEQQDKPLAAAPTPAPAPQPEPEGNANEDTTKVESAKVDASPSPSPSSPKDDPAPVEESPESTAPVEQSPEQSPEVTDTAPQESTAPEESPVESAAPEDVPTETPAS